MPVFNLTGKTNHLETKICVILWSKAHKQERLSSIDLNEENYMCLKTKKEAVNCKERMSNSPNILKNIVAFVFGFKQESIREPSASMI